MTKLINLACETLQIIVDREDAYDAINNKITKLQGDFSTYVQSVDKCILETMMKFLDAVLCDNASYWLYGCDRNGIVTTHGLAYPIRTVEDIKKYALKFSEYQT